MVSSLELLNKCNHGRNASSCGSCRPKPKSVEVLFTSPIRCLLSGRWNGDWFWCAVNAITDLMLNSIWCIETTVRRHVLFKWLLSTCMHACMHIYNLFTTCHRHPFAAKVSLVYHQCGSTCCLDLGLLFSTGESQNPHESPKEYCTQGSTNHYHCFWVAIIKMWEVEAW